MDKQQLISSDQALPGRETILEIATHHFVNGHPMHPPWPEGYQVAYFAMGCFWGVERLFWQQSGIWLTAAGYQGGFTPNPTYQEVCSGQTGHSESVQVVFNPVQISYENLLTLFWEQHNPTQGMRQGADIGTQYRSAIFTTNAEQQTLAQESKAHYQQALQQAGKNAPIQTEILPAPTFYHAENDHQQYLAKNPEGYCGLGGIGVCMPPQLAR